MDLIIRKISPLAVKQIERLAKEKGISREAYLRILLEDFSFLEKNAPIVDRLEKQLAANTIFLEQTDKTLSSLIEILSELIGYDNTSDSI